MKKLLLLLFAPACLFAQTWSPLGFGVSADVNVLFPEPVSQKLLVGGEFLRAGKHYTSKFSRWDGAVWDNINMEVLPTSSVHDFAFHKGVVYVAGNFTDVDGQQVNNIVSWNGTSWQGVGDGFDGIVRALMIYNDTLHAAGRFSLSGADVIGQIAKWDGTKWIPVGNGINKSAAPPTTDGIFCMAEYQGNLYAGGHFTDAGGVPVSHVAFYDGTRWNSLDAGVTGTLSRVNAMEPHAGELFVTGTFQLAGSVTANGIASWNGTVWSTLGNGLTGAVGQAEGRALYSNGTSLFVGGDFAEAGTLGNVVNNLASWNGATFSEINGGTDGSVKAITMYKNELYIGGSFTNVGLMSAPILRVAKYCPSTSSISGSVAYSGGALSGKVLLYAVNSSDTKMIKVATTDITAGNYTFSNVPSGRYVVQAVADTIYTNLVSTYHGDKFKWDKATRVAITCGTVKDSVDITVIEFPPLTGKGKVKGKVEEGFKFEKAAGDPVPGIDITVEQNPGGYATAMSVTEDTTEANAGEFSFEGLPNGDYKLSVEIPGLPLVSTYSFTISNTDTSYVDMNFSVDSNRIYVEGTSTVFNHSENLMEVEVYPNPFQHFITFNLKGNDIPKEINVELYDALGKLTFAEKMSGREQLQIEVPGLQSGTYLFRIYDQERLLAKGVVNKQ